MKKILSSILVISVMFVMLTACAAPQAPVAPVEAPAVEAPAQAPAVVETVKKITVGVNSENPPWIFMKDGTMTGFEADILEEFAKRNGYEVEYKSAPFSTVLTGVQSGQWDIAMSSIWVKQERVEVMDFADPYYDAQIGMMTPKDGLTSFAEMKGKVFGSDTGSANESWLKEAQAKYGPYEIKSYDYWADAVLDLETGRLDGVVVDAPIALYYIAQHPESDVAMPLYIDDYHFAQALAFTKGSALREEFNKVQNEMKKDGTMRAIFMKWFAAEPPADSSAINIIAPYLPNEKPAMEGAGAKTYDVPAKITVGVNSENPPWIFMKDGTMTGFEADILEEFAKRVGTTIEYKSAPFSTVLTGVQSGQWDIAMSSIWVKQERVEVMDFADPYYDAQIGMMTPKGGLTTFAEMKGKVFGSDTGSANESWLKEAQAKYGPYEIKSYDYWADAVLDLETGRLDGVVVDAPIALYYIAQHPESDVAMPLYIDDYHFAQALAFTKGSALRDTFNAVQNEMKRDGTMRAIFMKWFAAEPPADSSAINIIAPYLPNEKP
jgi:ABC-type amino acid transport substrate-binding protein